MVLCIADKEADIWPKSRMTIVVLLHLRGTGASNAAELSPIRRRSRSLWSEFVCGVSMNTYQDERLHMFVSAAGVVASGIEDLDSGQYAPEGHLKSKTWELAGCKKRKFRRQ